jgi:ferredoxin--NADP+ reductase
MMTAAEIDALRSKNYNATVVSIRLANPELMVLRVKPDFLMPTYKMGQYSTLGMGHWEPRAPDCQPEEPKPGEDVKLIRRAYSISHPILNDEAKLVEDGELTYLEFYIVLVRWADKEAPALTPRLFTLKQGDRLYLGEKIAGHYNLDPVKPTDNVVFLSTGTGEAPHNSMTWDLLRHGHTGRILSACCVRYKRDLAYLETHDILMKRYPNYKFLSLTTREVHNLDHKVYIQDLISSGQLEEFLGAKLNPENTHVFLCGNPKMIGVPNVDRATGSTSFPQPPGVIELLAAKGFRVDQHAQKLRGTIHFEEYW